MLSATPILHKTFQIRQGNTVGTGFIIELHNQEYLITAKHIVQNQAGRVEILHGRIWKDLPVTGIYHHPADADVAVVTVNQQVAPRYPSENSSSGISFGEGVMMAGFPSNIDFSQLCLNDGYPVPFVKEATVSGLVTQGGIDMWYFDGNAYAGFSGSPIIANRESSSDSVMEAKIIGVEVGYSIGVTRHPSEVHPQPKIGNYPIAVDHIHITDTGFITGIDLKHAIEIIQEHPYGFFLVR